MKIDWKIKGWNLLKFGCSRDSIIHPETCSDVVMLGHNNSLSLSNWITEDSTMDMKNSLSEWLAEYYATATLAIAANDETDSQQQIIHHAGIIYPSEGLTVIDEAGGLSLKKADSNNLGGIRLGYTDESGNNRGIQLDDDGRAFVNVDNISTDNYLQDWNGIITTQSPRVYFNDDDSLGSLNLSTYLTNFRDYYRGIGTPDWHRMYPVRTDIEGRLYAYVNWEMPHYYAFAGNDAGLVPNANSVTAKSTKFLNANGDWAPIDTIYGVFNSYVNGLVPKSTNSAAYLQGNGTWTVPQNTTYEVATPTVNEGLLQLNPEIPESNATLADNSEATSEFTDLFIPVVANSETAKCHGVSLKLIVDTIIDTPEILIALKDALNRDALNPSNT